MLELTYKEMDAFNRKQLFSNHAQIHVCAVRHTHDNIREL